MFQIQRNRYLFLNIFFLSIQSSVSKELDIRGELRNWDREFPFFHHELIVRYAAGFLASAVAVSVFGQVRSLFSSSKRNRYWIRKYNVLRLFSYCKFCSGLAKTRKIGDWSFNYIQTTPDNNLSSENDRPKQQSHHRLSEITCYGWQGEEHGS